MKPNQWVSMIGEFVAGDDSLTFHGGFLEQEAPTGPVVKSGVFITDLAFAGGEIRAEITFPSGGATVPFDGTQSLVGLVLLYVPSTGGFVTVQLGGAVGLVSVQTFVNGTWTTQAAHGQSHQLVADRPYRLSATVKGSRVSARLGGVNVVDVNLPFTMPRSQVGVWASGPRDIVVSQFDVSAEKPTLFVVMQFTEPFNELYQDVIRPVGEEAGYTVMRADEAYGPGIIIADIVRNIIDARAVVADITPTNPNVFWEVGYAYALQKPTILIAERGTQLPFDVSPFRTLFYDNTIAGKTRIEEGLRRHLASITEPALGGRPLQ